MAIVIVTRDMSDLSAVYEELLASNEGDILVKLKDGKQLKVISFLIKKRSPVFKTMLESSMQEAATGVVDLSSQYSLEAFREFMAYIYYNKLYTGSYVPLLFDILCITDYYEVNAYRTYINDCIVKLITNVPICLVIASEALKHGALTSKVYTKCLGFLVEIVEPQKRVCYDKHNGDSIAWSEHSKESKGNYVSYGYQVGQISGYPLALVSISQLPDFIVDDVNSAKIDEQHKSAKIVKEHMSAKTVKKHQSFMVDDD